MHKALHYGRGRDLLGGQPSAKREAWLTELYTKLSGRRQR